ncbi:Arc family DNA binding domain-containing protein [Robiginitalea sp. M366]|uniref:Arc family DNA binding domain-containing protein n=1 Tax=Robiginitalea aestuariiviva TaxID=3036903 RepID=UPI00240E26EA|nr:Arc family DNA binding domain-containing protein [Robiginitalea aestuariiviva]MDG1572263.1 Arc family DNA binding domain-containing protein [Robiginitalea aestuariiviva]
MSKRKSFVLRLDPELYKAVQKWADDEFRSVNGQLEWMIHKGLKDARRLPKKGKDRE